MALPQKSSGDETVVCCYDKSHVVLKYRLQTHLCKCRKQYPDKTLAICPFNTTHNIYEPEMQYHVESCPDRRKLDSYLFVIGNEPEKEPKLLQVEMPTSSENWDEQPECTSYLEEKDKIISKLPILRQPVGKSKSLRKKFFTQEVQKFNVLCNEDQKDSSVSVAKKISKSLNVISDSEEVRIGMGRGMKIEFNEINKILDPSRLVSPGYNRNGFEDDESDSYEE